MSNQAIEEKELTIKWLMQDDKIIKFEELDKTFDISDAVAKFDFEKAGVKSGSKVSVKIDKDEGTNGTVVFMKKSTGDSTSSQSASSSNTITKTVKAYGTKYNGSLLFTDDENTWYSCDKSIGVENLPQYKDKTVEIETRTGGKGGKYVTSIKIVEDQQSPSQDSTTSNKQNSYTKSNETRQASIEAQACMNHANIAISTLLAGTPEAKDQDLVKNAIQNLAEKNWEIVQLLKNKT